MGRAAMERSRLFCALMASVAVLAPTIAFSATPSADTISAGFANPPNSARPRVWWHWMNGNITKDGIRKDIEWMSRVGIGGLQNFDVDLLTPKVVDKRLVYMSPEWKDAFRFAAAQAEQHGLELAIASSPGWSETGGPWVKPVDAMKKLVWSETTVEGGRPFEGRLASPPQVTGAFADLPLEGSLLGPPAPNPPKLYADSAVMAYRIVDEDPSLLDARYSARDGSPIDSQPLHDGRLETSVTVDRGSADAPGLIQVDYPKPVTIQSLSLALSENTDAFGAGGAGVRPRLEAQTAGGTWSAIAEIDLRGAPQTTVSFAPVTSQHFRLIFVPSADVQDLSRPGVPGAATIPFGETKHGKTLGVREFRLWNDARINRFELKAGFGVAGSYLDLDPSLPEAHGVAPSDVIDLTAKMTPDGRLNWTPPAGRWKVLRLGYSLLGTTNHPTTKEASGLEVDKLDRAAVRRYLETYISNYTSATGPDLIGKHGLKALLTDSIEVGAANWTPQILQQFQSLRGYDPRPWLPAMTGALVGSRAQSDAFLYDWRRTLADLLASEHYGTVATVAHEHGLTLYGEALEDGRPMLGDDLTMRSHTDVPMSALWTYTPELGPKPSYIGDMRGAASVAHIYGQNLVAAESLTAAFSPWAFAPHDLKKFIDLEFVSGVNRPVIHTSVHQPLDDKQPGFSLFIFGQYFNRHETWAEMAKPWVDYMARSSFMLQQGRNFADVAYFIGEERPVTQLYVDKALGDLPQHYAFDFVSADMLGPQFTVTDGVLAAKGGGRYRILYLGGDSRKMTLKTLRRVETLARSGATIAGKPPLASPSLADDPKAFSALVARLWSGSPVTRIGRGQVVDATSPEAALASLKVKPDFETDRADHDVLFLHRRLKDGEAYFLTNRKDQAQSFVADFRVKGKAPQIWRAETGAAEPVTYRIEGGLTHVSLEMKPQDAFFVVFRKATKAKAYTLPKTTWRTAKTLDPSWEVSFQPGRGAPASTHLEHLLPLNESSDPGVKYFSGSAEYRTQFQAAAPRPGETVLLDLGAVGDIAEVRLNGSPLGTAWKAPFRVDVTKALRAGENTLEVKVADLWVNRLIGDQQPGAQKITFTTAPTYKPNAPLRPAGLIGPVTLVSDR